MKSHDTRMFLENTTRLRNVRLLRMGGYYSKGKLNWYITIFVDIIYISYRPFYDTVPNSLLHQRATRFTLSRQ